MSMHLRWETVIEALAEKGWSARVVAAARLSDLHSRVAAVLASGDLPEAAAARKHCIRAFRPIINGSNRSRSRPAMSLRRLSSGS